MADKMNTDYWNKFYGGGMNPSIPFVREPGSLGYTSAPTFQAGMMGRGLPPPVGSPNLTAEEQQMLQRQIEASKSLQAGYNPDGTPKPIPAAPFVGVPAPATWTSIDQAGYNSAKKPGTWLAQSRMNAQALMRQMAALQGGMPMAPGAVPAAAPSRGGLAALVTGKGTPRAKTPSLVSLLGATGTSTNGYVYQNGARVGVDPKYAGLTPSQRDAMLTAKPSKQDALIARATGAASSAEHDAWRKKTYGGDGYAMGGG